MAHPVRIVNLYKQNKKIAQLKCDLKKVMDGMLLYVLL